MGILNLFSRSPLEQEAEKLDLKLRSAQEFLDHISALPDGEDQEKTTAGHNFLIYVKQESSPRSAVDDLIDGLKEEMESAAFVLRSCEAVKPGFFERAVIGNLWLYVLGRNDALSSRDTAPLLRICAILEAFSLPERTREFFIAFLSARAQVDTAVARLFEIAIRVARLREMGELTREELISFCTRCMAIGSVNVAYEHWPE